MNDIEALRVVICQKMGVCKYYGGRCNTTRCAVEPDVARAALQAIIARWMEPTEDMAEAAHEIANRVADGHVLEPGYGVDVYAVWQAMLSEKAKEVDDG